MYSECSRLLDHMEEERKRGWLFRRILKKSPLLSRTIRVGTPYNKPCPPNVVRNQKYSILTFLPLILYEQFKFFLNLFFLCIALSQFIDALKIGSILSYWGPLGFVLSITVLREGYEDFLRFYRDKKINKQKYEKLLDTGSKTIVSSDIRVGDILILHKNQRIPADVVLLQTSEHSGGCFIRTDQLDGETDWKQKLAIPQLQQLERKALFGINCQIYVESPHRDINTFIGTCEILPQLQNEKTGYPLGIDNVLWASTTLTAGTAVVLVIYTGKETRAQLNMNNPHSKVGLLDLEINRLTKVVFGILVFLTLGSLAVAGFNNEWPRQAMRFALLYSYIIPLSLRVNLEMAKLYYCYTITSDKAIEGTQVRSSSIPEELGRISYLLTDKTGTLTKNEMRFRKLCIDGVTISDDAFSNLPGAIVSFITETTSDVRASSNMTWKLARAVEAIALCHNVTPVHEDGTKIFQAASPDEIALVEWAESINVMLSSRGFDSIVLQIGTQHPVMLNYHVLYLFPFTPERKRMGIIIRNSKTNKVTFICKGADTVMAEKSKPTTWLDEETANMAREGLRTLVVCSKTLTPSELEEFEKHYHEAMMSVKEREKNVEKVIKTLETNLDVLCITGVEDQLQSEVRTSIESLLQAGIKICMLTGDKVETAVCIARSCGIVSKTSAVTYFNQQISTPESIIEEIQKIKDGVTTNSVLVIAGHSIERCLEYDSKLFSELFFDHTSVVCCRCSPEQKANIVKLFKTYRSHLRVAAIGDGGNDVAMIQEAHVGIGIEAKEGKQASLAADFAIGEFSHLCSLFMVHGRYAYKQTCVLAQFIIYRGVIIGLMQAIFCYLNFMNTISVFDTTLMMLHTCIYTPLAVFAIVTDRDTTKTTSLMYAELYKKLVKGRLLTIKTFLIWILIAVYQASALYYGFLLFQDDDISHFQTTVFSALVATNLLMVLVVIRRMTIYIILAEVQCFCCLFISWVLPVGLFNTKFVFRGMFYFQLISTTTAAVVPVVIIRVVRHFLAPPSTTKLN